MISSTAVQQPWERVKQSLLEQIRELDDVTCRLPGFEDPVLLDAGLRWLEDGLRRGLDVDYRVVREPGGAVVWLQRWSPEEPRPPWPEEWDDPDEGARE
jgi:hypothetical protein